MADITSNGTGGGDWSVGGTWTGGTPPGVGDNAIIQSGDTVYIDGDITIGDGSTSYFSVWQLNIQGNLVWRNEAGDASSNWTLNIYGSGIRILYPGRFFIGTEDDSLFGSKSVGPIPATRKATINFTLDYLMRVQVDNHDDGTSAFEFWGAENYHQDAPPSITSQTVDSATDKISFIDSGRSGDTANKWRGAWLEITAGTNVGQKREITVFDNTTGKISWSANQPMPDPCDSSSVYSIVHNYHRAMLLSDASAGSTVDIYLDRPANWSDGDEVVIAVGVDYAQQTEKPERVQLTKIDASHYTADLTYDHKAGDFIVHLDKNIVFNSTDLTGSQKSYWFYFTNGTGNFFKCYWTFFDNSGTPGNDFFSRGSGYYFPVMKHVTAFGHQYSTSNPTGDFIDARGWRFMPEEYQIEDIHICNHGGLLDMGGQFSTDNPIEDKERMLFRNFTLIGMGVTATSGQFTGSDHGVGIVPRFYNIWATGRSFEVVSNEYGYGYYGGAAHIDGFKFYQVNRGIWMESAIGSSQCGVIEDCAIKNGLIHYAHTLGVLLDTMHAYQVVVENVDIRSAVTAAIQFEDCPSSNVYLINNKINACGIGLKFLPQASVGSVYEHSGEYGVDDPNINHNIDLVGSQTMDECSIAYISQNTKYVTPSSPILTEFLINKVFDQSTGSGTLKQRKFRAINSLSKMQLVNPTIDGTPYHSMALTHAWTLVEIVEHPTVPRVNSNIKMKITPYAALGEAHVNFADPIVFELTANDDVTVSVWFRKNISQLAGYTPKLTIIGCGFYKSAQMSDAIDTWEKVSISFTARYTGTVMAWISCYNNLAYPKDDLNGYDAEPAAQGTVVVYADEFDVSIVE